MERIELFWSFKKLWAGDMEVNVTWNIYYISLKAQLIVI